MKRAIETSYVCPPIPIRSFDWQAYRDPESKYQGSGQTKDLAILDLLECETADSDGEAPYECDCGQFYQEATSVLV